MATAKKRGLGRGLASLLGEEEGATQAQSSQSSVRADRQVPIEKLHPSRVQPRLRFDPDALAALADSIRQQGVIQPILVRNHDEKPGEFEIVAGERRWRAAQQARLHEVPIVLRALSDSEALEVAIVENVQRQDLDPVEEGEGYHRLMQEFGHTQEDVARLIGKSRSHVANTLRLLALPGEVKEMISEGRLSAGHARTLLSSEDPTSLAREIIAKGLNVRQAEALAKAGKPRGPRAAPTGGAKDPDTLRLEESLSENLGLKVTIEGKGESGRLSVHYSTLEQLDSLLAKLNGES